MVVDAGVPSLTVVLILLTVIVLYCVAVERRVVVVVGSTEVTLCHQRIRRAPAKRE